MNGEDEHRNNAERHSSYVQGEFRLFDSTHDLLEPVNQEKEAASTQRMSIADFVH